MGKDKSIIKITLHVISNTDKRVLSPNMALLIVLLKLFLLTFLYFLVNTLFAEIVEIGGLLWFGIAF